MKLDVPLLLAQIVVIVLVARVSGLLLARLGQPRVVGEMVAGIVLGPSVFGALAPGAAAALFPAESIPVLGALSQVGLLFFMFIVGLEIDLAHLRSKGASAVAISQASIIVPFALGVVLSAVLYPRVGPAGVTFWSFALFVGAAMSVTAFPVLARILSERRLTQTRLGTIAIACAAVDDVSAWCILAGVVMLAREGQAAQPWWLLLGGTVLWVAFVLTLGRRLLRALRSRFQARGALSQNMLAVTILAVLGSAFVTERLGVHALFGAFLVGAAMPRDPELVRQLQDKLEDVMVVLLLPLFFAVTGLRTRIGLLGSGDLWLLAGAVSAVAIAGKLGGSALAARATGLPWREALALGTLMNTRGLMELVILTVGLDIGVISSALFAMMVLMALVTTFMTTPLLALLMKGGDHASPDDDRRPVGHQLHRHGAGAVG